MLGSGLKLKPLTKTIFMNTPNQSGAKFVGFVALAYAASLIVQNVMFGGDAPTYSTPISNVLTYHAENQDILAITSGLEATNMVLLLLLVTALHGLIQRRGGTGADWSRLAVAAGASLASLSALLIATHIAVIVTANGLTEPNPAFEIMWRLHAAVFALTLPALGATFIGVSLATDANGLTRSWQRVLGLLGGSLAIIAGCGNLAIAGGSPLLFVGVAGLGLWIVWLIATSIRLIRS
jgi:hypothetical protein